MSFADEAIYSDESDSDNESINDSDNEDKENVKKGLDDEEDEEEEDPKIIGGKVYGEEEDVEEEDGEEDVDSLDGSDDEKMNLDNPYIPNQLGGAESDEDEEDEDNFNSNYLQKFNEAINKNYILDNHPECAVNNYDEINQLTRIVRDKANNIIDDLHRSIPYLTKYERTRVIGQRAKQINAGATAFIKVPEHVIDGYLIAELELVQKRIPFIIRRPIPGGSCEYWNLKDLEIVSF
jgi:DNA-directed RNA polymerase I, II, and III subunit RPABC2